MSKSAPRKPLSWVNLCLGTVLLVAPFLSSFIAGPAAIWNASLIGALIVICSALEVWCLDWMGECPLWLLAYTRPFRS